MTYDNNNNNNNNNDNNNKTVKPFSAPNISLLLLSLLFITD